MKFSYLTLWNVLKKIFLEHVMRVSSNNKNYAVTLCLRKRTNQLLVSWIKFWELHKKNLFGAYIDGYLANKIGLLKWYALSLLYGTQKPGYNLTITLRQYRKLYYLNTSKLKRIWGSYILDVNQGVSGGKKYSFFRKFGMLCFLVTPV